MKSEANKATTPWEGPRGAFFGRLFDALFALGEESFACCRSMRARPYRPSGARKCALKVAEKAFVTDASS